MQSNVAVHKAHPLMSPRVAKSMSKVLVSVRVSEVMDNELQ